MSLFSKSKSNFKSKAKRVYLTWVKFSWKVGYCHFSSNSLYQCLSFIVGKSSHYVLVDEGESCEKIIMLKFSMTSVFRFLPLLGDDTTTANTATCSNGDIGASPACQNAFSSDYRCSDDKMSRRRTNQNLILVLTVMTNAVFTINVSYHLISCDHRLFKFTL